MPSPRELRPSLPSVHTALNQLGYRLVAQNGAMRCYQHQEHPEVALFLDIGELTTFEDISRVLRKNGENPDAFFAMYESLIGLVNTFIAGDMWLNFPQHGHLIMASIPWEMYESMASIIETAEIMFDADLLA